MGESVTITKQEQPKVVDDHLDSNQQQRKKPDLSVGIDQLRLSSQKSEDVQSPMKVR
jgi:hypothetical protein